MKSAAILLLVALACTSALAAGKPCEELKSETAAKLDAAGVKNYVLEVIEPAKTGDAKVVGSCDGGTKRITYFRK